MFIKLQDKNNTIVDLTAIQLISQFMDYKEFFGGFNCTIVGFTFYLKTKVAKYEIFYSGYDVSVGDFTIKGNKEGLAKFMTDYQLIEDFLLNDRT